MHMLGFSDVIVHPAEGEECPPSGAAPDEIVMALSRAKAREVATGLHEDALVIAADTIVWLDELSDDEIRSYIATGEPMDKAGAYGAQGKGALFVRAIEGDFFNVMGLPVCRLGQMLAKKGVPVL